MGLADNRIGMTGIRSTVSSPRGFHRSASRWGPPPTAPCGGEAPRPLRHSRAERYPSMVSPFFTAQDPSALHLWIRRIHGCLPKLLAITSAVEPPLLPSDAEVRRRILRSPSSIPTSARIAYGTAWGQAFSSSAPWFGPAPSLRPVVEICLPFTVRWK